MEFAQKISAEIFKQRYMLHGEETPEQVLAGRDASISKGGESSGPLSFLKVFNASAKTIRNGGGRCCLPLYYQVVMGDGLPLYYQVVMGDGTLKPITDIKEGDFVLFEEKQYKVNAVYHNGVQKLVRIETSAGKWHVSALNHRWLVRDNYVEVPVWVEAKNLMPELFPKYSFMSLKTEQDPDDAGYALDLIVKLEFLPAEDTIDIEVDEVHAFYAYNPESDLASISRGLPRN